MTSEVTPPETPLDGPAPSALVDTLIEFAAPAPDTPVSPDTPVQSGHLPRTHLCRAYGEAARPIAGIWGGKTYKPPKQRQTDATRRTADTTEMEITNR